MKLSTCKRTRHIGEYCRDGPLANWSCLLITAETHALSEVLNMNAQPSSLAMQYYACCPNCLNHSLSPAPR